MDDDLKAIEAQLEKLSPLEMPEDMLARMERAMESWQTEVTAEEEKVVPFDRGAVEEKQQQGRHWSLGASAAAVALIGASSLLIFGGQPKNTTPALAENDGIVAEDTSVPMSLQGVVPATNTQFDRRLRNAGESSISYDSNGRPLRVMRVEYEDEITVRGRDGKLYKMKQPRTEYYAVPLEIH